MGIDQRSACSLSIVRRRVRQSRDGGQWLRLHRETPGDDRLSRSGLMGTPGRVDRVKTCPYQYPFSFLSMTWYDGGSGRPSWPSAESPSGARRAVHGPKGMLDRRTTAASAAGIASSPGSSRRKRPCGFDGHQRRVDRACKTGSPTMPTSILRRAGGNGPRWGNSGYAWARSSMGRGGATGPKLPEATSNIRRYPRAGFCIVSVEPEPWSAPRLWRSGMRLDAGGDQRRQQRSWSGPSRS